MKENEDELQMIVNVFVKSLKPLKKNKSDLYPDMCSLSTIKRKNRVTF